MDPAHFIDYSVLGSYDWGMNDNLARFIQVPGKWFSFSPLPQSLAIGLVSQLIVGAPAVWPRCRPGQYLPGVRLSPLNVESAHDVPSFQFEASLRAIKSLLPAFKLDDVDVLASQRALEKLFNYVAGEATESILLHLDVIGCTLVIEDRGALYDEVELAKFLTFVAHPETIQQEYQCLGYFKITERHQERCRGHFRVLKYNIGPLNCIVRCLSESSLSQMPQQMEKHGAPTDHLQTPLRPEPDIPNGNGSTNINVENTPNNPESATRGHAIESSTTLKPLAPKVTIVHTPESPGPLSGSAPPFTPNTAFQLPGENSARPLMANNPYPLHTFPRYLKHLHEGQVVTVQGATGADVAASEFRKLRISTNDGPNNHTVDALLGSEPSPQVDAQAHTGAGHEDRHDGTGAQLPEPSTADNQLTQESLVAVQCQDISHKDGPTDSPNMTALYLSRTFNSVYVGYVNNGHIETTAEHIQRRTLTGWGAKQENQVKLGKLASLLRHLSKVCRERHSDSRQGTGRLAVFNINQADSPALRIVSAPDSVLKPPLRDYMIRELWSEAVLLPERHV